LATEARHMADAVQVGPPRSRRISSQSSHGSFRLHACRPQAIHRRHPRHAQRRNVHMTDAPSIDPAESRSSPPWLAEWWDPAGKFAPLHKFNPSGWRSSATRRGPISGAQGLKPFQGLSLLDIGCGGGLLSEPMARLGFCGAGADASEKERQNGGGPCRLRPASRSTTG